MHNDPPALGLVKHPVILAGLAVLGLLLIVAGILTMLDGGDDGSSDTTTAAGSRLTPTPARTSTVAGSGVRTIRATSVHSAPSHRNPVFGTMPAGADLNVVGRNEDASWLEIEYPPGSDLMGWVDAEDVEAEGDLLAYAEATPESLPIPELPTLPPGTLKTPIGYTPEPTMETATATPVALADLVIGIPVSFIGGSLVVTVINQGAGPATGTIHVAVFDASGQTLLGGAPVPVEVLPAGGRIDVNTGFTGKPGVSRILVTVNPAQLVGETDYSNNQLSVSVNLTAATPTPPLPETPTATATLVP